MRRPLAALALLLAGCSLGSATPPPMVSPEVLLIRAPDGSRSIVRAPAGSILGRLPPGLLSIVLSSGDDIAEAYLVASSSPGTVVSAVVPAKGYGLDRLAAEPGAPVASVLAPAPALTSFVGRQTVLAVLTGDGALTGYQHGTRLWSAALGQPVPELRQVGGQVVVGQAGTWRSLQLETGTLGVASTRGDCSPGPVAEVGGGIVFDCGGRLSLDGSEVPAELPAVFPVGTATLLAFSDGEIWQVKGGAARLAGRGPAWTVPPTASLDGSLLFVPTVAGVERVATATGSHRLLLATAGANPSVALSRDGNFLYALAAGTLRTYSLGGGVLVASIPVAGVEIERVVGG